MDNKLKIIFDVVCNNVEDPVRECKAFMKEDQEAHVRRGTEKIAFSGRKRYLESLRKDRRKENNEEKTEKQEKQ